MVNCFKAYDLRGKYPSEINETMAKRIGWAFANVLNCNKVVVGYDIRSSSSALMDALCEGLVESGVTVLDIGLCGTEEVYFATSYENADGGIMITASHNPADYNGMKMVGPESRAMTRETGLDAIQAFVEEKKEAVLRRGGSRQEYSCRNQYIEHLLSYIDVNDLSPLRVVVNPGNGGAGLVLDHLKQSLPFEFVNINYEPDGSFPNGVPNPLLPENRCSTSCAVEDSKADFGIAWDGDFDRCFLFDENGDFVEGYYIVGLLASMLLKKHPGGRIVHDPRLIWNTIELVEKCGGVPLQSRTGHSLIKQSMRENDAVYGGEMSAHHYFREFFYCDSGMIPWLLVAALVSSSGQPLSEHVAKSVSRYPSSGEINILVSDVASVLSTVRDRFRSDALSVEYVDGVSLCFADWRFNLRASNTESLLRLNVESRGSAGLVKEKVAELLDIIHKYNQDELVC